MALKNDKEALTDPEMSKDFYSSPCLKSGIILILFSFLLISLFPKWKYFYVEKFSIDYILTRNLLDTAIEFLEYDECWNHYLQENPNAKNYTLRTLLEINCSDFKKKKISSKPTIEFRKKIEDSDVSTIELSTAPTFLRIIVPIPEVESILDYFEKLNNVEFLNKARKNPHLDLAIYKWRGLLTKLIYTKECQNKAQNNNYDIDVKQGAVHQDMLVNCLTFKEIKTISKYHLPTFSEKEFALVGENITNLALQPGSIPKTLYSASITIMSIIIILLFYFVTYLNEAIRTNIVFLKGSLFRVFHGSLFSIVIFSLLICVPTISCFILSCYAKKIIFFVLSIATLILTAMILKKMHSTGFYSSKKQAIT